MGGGHIDPTLETPHRKTKNGAKTFCLVFLKGLSIVVSMLFTKFKYIIFLKSC